jgi:uncharacterized protein
LYYLPHGFAKGDSMDPETFFTQAQQPRQPHKEGRGLLLFIIIFGLIMLFWQAVGLITDWFWFQEVGYEQVFTVTFMAQLLVGLLFGGAFFLILYANLKLANRLSERMQLIFREGAITLPSFGVDTHLLKRIILIASLVLSLFVAQQAGAEWEQLLRFIKATPFGIKDPLFDRDIGFYVFQMPFLHQVYGWLMAALVITTLATGLIYLMRRTLLFIPPKTLQLAPAARAHLLALLAALFLAATFGFWLDLADILYVKRGVVFGPGYTDVTTQLGVLRLLIVLCPLVAASLLFYIFKRSLRIPTVLIAIFLAVLVVGRGIYPEIVQRFKVIPNEMV